MYNKYRDCGALVLARINAIPGKAIGTIGWGMREMTLI